MVELRALPPSAPESTIFAGKRKDSQRDLRKLEALTLGATPRERHHFAEIHACLIFKSMLRNHAYVTKRGDIPERTSRARFAYH